MGGCVGGRDLTYLRYVKPCAERTSPPSVPSAVVLFWVGGWVGGWVIVWIDEWMID